MPKRFKHGLVLGKFYPLHAGHSHLIRTALCACESVTVELLGATIESIPLETRAEWIREEHPSVRLRTAIDDAEVDFESESAWAEHMVLIEELLDEPVDAVFTSDTYGDELARRLGATWVQVDPNRSINPVSATAVRADVPANWHLLPAPVREWLVKRIVIVGAESTGTTTLAQALADSYGVPWVPEYGREYSVQRAGGLDRVWDSEEFRLIAGRQILDERVAARRSAQPFIICDTDVLATALWHERYVGTASRELRLEAESHTPLLYVLSGDDIPFVQDGLRDGEHIRGWMQERFRDELSAQATPWFEVRGSVSDRVAAARAVIDAAMVGAFQFADPLEVRRQQRETQ